MNTCCLKVLKVARLKIRDALDESHRRYRGNADDGGMKWAMAIIRKMENEAKPQEIIRL
ncbi:MAG: hypothetical protein ABIG63_07870 [Chloroflexota bacterium]